VASEGPFYSARIALARRLKGLLMAASRHSGRRNDPKANALDGGNPGTGHLVSEAMWRLPMRRWQVAERPISGEDELGRKALNYCWARPLI
jgi:hypothetical protein